MPDRLKQVAAGEPSLGTSKQLVVPIVIATINPGSTPTTTTVTVAGLSAGTKAIEGWYEVIDTTVGDSVAIREYGTSVNRAWGRCIVAGLRHSFWFKVKIDNNFRFDVWASHLDISAIDITITGYYS